jgi:hypothetical protein
MRHARFSTSRPNKNPIAAAAPLLLVLLGGCQTPPPVAPNAIDTAPISVPALNLAEHQKQVNLVYYENKAPVPGKDIVFCYYDEPSSSRITKPMKTDASGVLSIAVPGSTDDASSVFTFALAGATIPDAALGVRIPPKSLHGGQRSITIKFDATMLVYNEGAPMEPMALPKAGAKVDSVEPKAINIVQYDSTTGTVASQGAQLAGVNGQIKPIGVGDVLLEGSRFTLANK